MNNEELLLKKATHLLNLIQTLDTTPTSVDNNPDLKDQLLMCGEVLARSVVDDSQVNDTVRERVIRKQKGLIK